MEETEHHPSKRSGTGLFLGQTGDRLAELEQRTRHLLLPLLPRDWRGKEVAMASAVSVHPTSPGCMLVAAVSLPFQGFGTKGSWQQNHSHVSAHGYPGRALPKHC